MTDKTIRIYCGNSLTLRDGLRYHYVDEGQGDPVVMVHGNPSWSLYYRRLVSALSPHFRCIVPDHIGCGLSDKPDDSRYHYTLSSRIDDLESLIDHLGLTEKITLIMHDWGGAIGMGYATRHPERIKQLVILNTAAFELPESKGQIPKALKLGRDTRLGAWLIDGLNAFSIGASWVGCKQQPMSANLRRAYQLPYREVGARIATLRFVQDIPLDNGDPAMATLREIQDKLHLFRETPILACWGMKDFVFDGHFLERFLEYWPHMEVYRFPGAGHYILEDAWQDVVPLIQDFLQQRAPSGATV